MAETLLQTANPPPFRDIINRSFEAIQNQRQNCKSKQKQQINRHRERSLSHKSSLRSDIIEKNDSDLTVRKEKPSLHPELVSVKTIHDQRCQMANEEIDHAEWEVFKNQQEGEIARNLKLNSDFAELKVKFVQFARKSKLIMCQNTESFVTVRKGGAGSCRCLYQMWTNSAPQATVYQLRKYGRNDARAKLILVEGDKDTFYSFFIKCLKHFSSQKLIQVLPGETVEIIFQEQSKEVHGCRQVIGQLSKRMAKGKRIDPSQIDSLVTRLKKQSIKLRQTIRNISNLCDIPSMEVKVELMCYKTSGILSLFDQLYHKEFQLYRKKREALLKKHPISELFKLLEIQEHYNQFKRLRSLKQIQIEEKIPYLTAIKDLKLLANSQFPTTALEIVILFHQRIRSCYSRYFKNCLRLGDMDDYLPVTIFCVLAVDCDQNLLAVVKWLLSQLNGAEDNEWQKKTLTDLEAAFEYIQNQWQIA